MLFVDASHLSGPYDGTVLGAVALDADNHLFDVAYAMVASENNDDWLWLLSVLSECLGGHEAGDNDGQAWNATAFSSESVWGGEPLLLPCAYEGELRSICWEERGWAESDEGFGEGNVQ